MTSTAYRQDSAARPDALKADPENVLVWRFTPRRLEGEVIRDAVLAVSGTLDLKMYGEPVHTKTKPTGEVVPIEDPKSGRRSVYQLVRRSAPQSFLQVFDAPVMETNCTRRVNSTSALQSLAFMNSEFATKKAELFAQRVLKEAPPQSGTDTQAIKRAIELAFGRPARNDELENMVVFIGKQSAKYPNLTSEALTMRVYADLCQVLMSTSEFVYVD